MRNRRRRRSSPIYTFLLVWLAFSLIGGTDWFTQWAGLLITAGVGIIAGVVVSRLLKNRDKKADEKGAKDAEAAAKGWEEQQAKAAAEAAAKGNAPADSTPAPDAAPAQTAAAPSEAAAPQKAPEPAEPAAREAEVKAEEPQAQALQASEAEASVSAQEKAPAASAQAG